jgi:hypothetical protein
LPIISSLCWRKLSWGSTHHCLMQLNLFLIYIYFINKFPIIFSYSSNLINEFIDNLALTSKTSFWEEVWGEFHSCLHVSFNFHFSLHKCILGVQLSLEQRECVLINQWKSGISFSLFSVLDGSWAVFKIDGPCCWLFSFGWSDFEMINKTNFFDNVCTLSFKEGFHFVEAGCGLEWHILQFNGFEINII